MYFKVHVHFLVYEESSMNLPRKLKLSEGSQRRGYCNYCLANAPRGEFVNELFVLISIYISIYKKIYFPLDLELTLGCIIYRYIKYLGG